MNDTWTPDYTHQPPELGPVGTRPGRKSAIGQAIDALTVGQFFQAPPELDKNAADRRGAAVTKARKAHPDWVITVGKDAAGNVWIGRDR
jgi:hypothetical protein